MIILMSPFWFVVLTESMTRRVIDLFQVEDTVFRVPNYLLVRNSPKLKELLSVDDDLITLDALDGVLASDFERLLSLVFRLCVL